MKKFVIIFAIVVAAYGSESSAAGAPGSLATCKGMSGADENCRPFKMAMVKCVPRKCLMSMGKCMHGVTQVCQQKMQECEHNLMGPEGSGPLSQCHNQRHACEQKAGGNKCHGAFDQCFKAVQPALDKCQKKDQKCRARAGKKMGKNANKCGDVGMKCNMDNVDGYKACFDKMISCYKGPAKNHAGCSEEFGGCVGQLKDHDAMNKCWQKQSQCDKRTPMGKCNRNYNECQNRAGMGKCNQQMDQCHRSLPPTGCDSAFDQCADEAGLRKCHEDEKTCVMSQKPGPMDCIKKGLECAKTDKAKKCMQSFIQMKSMEHNPPMELQNCLKDKAGVQAMDWKHSGNACKIGGCVVPKLAAPEARCYMDCFFHKGCNCAHMVNGCSAFEEEEFEEEYSTEVNAFHSIFNL